MKFMIYAGLLCELLFFIMHKTRLIILKAVKYGETSFVVTAFTERFGVQSYMVSGVRSPKKTGMKAALYQPASLLEAEVYHNEKATLQRIKESDRSFIFREVQTDVIKNSIALFMMELLYKLLKQPENNPELFYFCEDMLMQLDEAPATVAANIPLFFMLHLSHFFGFRIDDNYSEVNPFLDLQEGSFMTEQPRHAYFLSDDRALISSEILKMSVPGELEQLKMNREKRRELLHSYLRYYALHLQDFGTMKTLAVMQEIWG